MQRALRWLVLSLAPAVVAGIALASVPAAIDYQGRLTGPDGLPLPGPVDLVVIVLAPGVSLPDAVLYSERHDAVELVDGVFAIEIGRGDAATGTFGPELFAREDLRLAVSVDGEMLAPSQSFSSVAYALRAGVAKTLDLECEEGDVVRFQEGAFVCAPAAAPGCFPGDRIACYTGPPETASNPPCATGVRVCDEDGFGICAGDVTPEPEICNGADDDCNGESDDGVELPGCVLGFADADGDGFGDDFAFGCRCGAVVETGGDCDDTDAAVRPDQPDVFTEPRSDGSFDYDCDGEETPPAPLFTGCRLGEIVPACGGSAWKDPAPDCGDPGTFVVCSGLGTCSTRETLLVRGCH